MDIEQYLMGCSNKSRILIVLLSTGIFTFSALRVFTVADLLLFSKKNGDSLGVQNFNMFCDDIAFQKNHDEFVFVNPSGRKLSEKDMQNVLIKACQRAGKPYTRYQQFVERFSG